jgi:ribose transport system ATP-binding protein
MTGRTIALEAQGITKSFGGVRALYQAALAAVGGEVHALVGENGAGKSTLIKILGGRLQPDTGSVRINHHAVGLTGPDDAHALATWTVFQELTLLPWMTVAENLLLRREPRASLGLISRTQVVAQAEAMLAGLGICTIDPLALVEDLSLAQRQIVEIVRALSHAPDILLLDEPTSSLVEHEVMWLFKQISELRRRGACVIFTSHRWSEVSSIADRITVFRGGRHVGTFPSLSESEAVTLMTGEPLDTLYPKLPERPLATSALEVQQLTGTRLHGVSFTLHRGEILGVGGLAGQGHRELFFTLFGAEHASSGRVVIDRRSVRIRSPRDAVRRRAGIALVPEDRKTDGLMLAMAVRDNLTLAILRRIAWFGVLRRRIERHRAESMATRLKIRMAGLRSPAGSLSGGNQQKVLVGRWLLVEPTILLLYDITRGVDIATKHELYELMMQLATEGRSILFYSSDTEELAHLCHRVLVMREGKVATELNAPDITAEHIVAAAVRDRLAA